MFSSFTSSPPSKSRCDKQKITFNCNPTGKLGDLFNILYDEQLILEDAFVEWKANAGSKVDRVSAFFDRLNNSVAEDE